MTFQLPGTAPVDQSVFVDALPDMAFLLDDCGRVVFANAACQRSLGWDARMLGTPAIEFVHPDDAAVVATSMVTIHGKPVGSPIEFRIRDHTGGWRWVELIGCDLTGDDDLNGYVCVARDISDRKMWSIAGNDLARFEYAFQNAASLTVLLDGEGRITGTNNAFNRVLGHDKSVAIGHPLEEFVLEDSKQQLRAAIGYSGATNESCAVEVAMRRAGKSSKPCLMRFEFRGLSTDANSFGLIATGQDITELDAMRRELQHLAQHDPLTGLANRDLLHRTIDAKLQSETAFVIMFIDLDGFKRINDRYGHRLGDRLLEAVASRLSLALRPEDLIARVGGDEFVVVAEIDELTSSTSVKQRLQEAIREPFVAAETTFRIRASIGVASSRSGVSTDELLDEADAAMYRDKRQQAYDVKGGDVKGGEALDRAG